MSRRNGYLHFKVFVLHSLFLVPVLGHCAEGTPPSETPALNLLSPPSKGGVAGGVPADLLLQSFEAFQAKNYLIVPGLLNRALEASRANGDKSTEALILFAQSQVFLKLGAKEKASALQLQGAAILEAVEDREEAAMAYLALGWMRRKLGANADAEKAFDRGMEVARAAGSKRVEALAATSLGWLYQQIGENQKWIAASDVGIEASRIAGDSAGEAWALLCKSSFYAGGNGHQYAEEILLRALERIRAPRIAVHESPFMSTVRSLLYDKLIEAKILEALGNANRALKRLEKAADYTQQSIKLALAAGADFYAGYALLELAGINADLGRNTQQMDNLQQALTITRRSGNTFGESQIWLNLGLAYTRDGDLRKAREAFENSIERGDAAQRKQPHALLFLARTEAALGITEKASQHWQEALQIVEATRDSMGGLSEAKQIYMADRMGYYQDYIAFLESSNQPEMAFTWIEKTKARSLLDLMQNGKANLDRELSNDERAKLHELRSRADEWNRKLIAQSVNQDSSSASPQELRASLTHSEKELQEFSDTLLARYPTLAQRRSSQTVTADETAEVLADDTALLSYVFSGNSRGARASFYCVTKEEGKSKLRRYVIDATRDELTELLDDFQEACADPKKSFRTKASELYKLLVAPAAEQIKGKKRLILCPDGPIWGVPFQALIERKADGDKFLLENYEISYSYSATTLKTTLTTQRTEPKKFVGDLLVYANPDFGGARRLALNASNSTGSEAAAPPLNPDAARPIGADARALTADSRALTADSRALLADSRVPAAGSAGIVGRGGEILPLPGTQVEADALRVSFPGAHIVTGAGAQEADVKSKGGQYRYLHFATHGVFNDTAPLLSSLVLAQPPAGSKEDGFLTAREIFDLQWNVDLVVLSACNTGRGQKRSGEGVVGLTWALFASGAPSQVVSQWAVNDSSTALLMKSLYNELEKKRPRGEALRAASLSLLRDGAHQHPYYWAPFILMGDWR